MSSQSRIHELIEVVRHDDRNVRVVSAHVTRIKRYQGHISYEPVISGVGTARRDADDHYDRQTAEDLALGRALINAGQHLVKEAMGRNKMLEDNRNRYHKPNPAMQNPVVQIDPDLERMLEEEEEIERRNGNGNGVTTGVTYFNSLL